LLLPLRRQYLLDQLNLHYLHTHQILKPRRQGQLTCDE
jgi:hypothetical protein